MFKSVSPTQTAIEALGGILKMNAMDALAIDLMGANPTLDLETARKYAGLILKADAADDYVLMHEIVQEALFVNYSVSKCPNCSQGARFENGRLSLTDRHFSPIC
jgi:hypothetical protein